MSKKTGLKRTHKLTFNSYCTKQMTKRYKPRSLYIFSVPLSTIFCLLLYLKHGEEEARLEINDLTPLTLRTQVPLYEHKQHMILSDFVPAFS